MLDSGYINIVGYLAPISDKTSRYHHPEWQHGPPVGSAEHFNYRHSSLRMRVEQGFGQLKKRWKVLYVMPQMSQKCQMSIIVSAFTLHNFILMQKFGIPILQHGAREGTTDTNMSDPARIKKMKETRDKIVKQIWDDNRPPTEDMDEEVQEHDDNEDDSEQDG